MKRLFSEYYSSAIFLRTSFITMTMKPFITTDYTELQSNPGTTSNRTGPVQRYSLNYLDQNWRFINDKSMIYAELHHHFYKSCITFYNVY